MAKDIVEQLERAGLQIIPRSPDDAQIRGRFGPDQQRLLEALLPDLKTQWFEVVKLLASRDENEAAAATLRMIAAGSENPAATLGRRGGLKGGPARAAAMTKKERSESAKKAARARWRKERSGKS